MDILFLNSTSTAPFEVKFALEHSIGGTNAAGVLESFGHNIDLYDLNAMLNEFNDETLLSKEELKYLTHPETIISVINDDLELPLKIQFWIRSLSLDLPDTNGFDAVCVSLNRWMYTYYPSIASFSLVCYILKEMNTRVPIFIGGEYAFEMMESYNCLDLFTDNISFINIVRGRDISKFNDMLNEKITYPKNIVLGQTRRAQLEFKVDSKNEVTTYIKDIFPEEIYNKYDKLHGVETLTLSPFKFSEGCLFKCAFCPSGIDPTFIKSSAMETVDNLERLYDKGFTDFKFFNDNLNFKIRFLIEFANEIVRRGMKIRFSDSANLRVGNEEMFNAISEAGCVKLWYGTETISNRILKEVHKEVGENQVHKMMQWAKNAGIMNCSNFIFNFPHETDEEFYMLHDFIIEYINNGLMDAYKLSEFRVLLNTEYEKFPENFNIKLTEIHEADKMWKYDEIGGLSWTEKKKIGREREKLLRDVVSKRDLSIITSDHLIFGLRKAGYDAKETMGILHETTKVMPDNILDKIVPDIATHPYYKNNFLS